MFAFQYSHVRPKQDVRHASEGATVGDGIGTLLVGAVVSATVGVNEVGDQVSVVGACVAVLGADVGGTVWPSLVGALLGYPVLTGATVGESVGPTHVPHVLAHADMSSA